MLVSSKSATRLQHVGVWVRPEVAELQRPNFRFVKNGMGMAQMACSREPRVGDQQRSGESQFLCQGANPPERAIDTRVGGTLGSKGRRSDVSTQANGLDGRTDWQS